jgi:hypothetical protein
LGVWDSIVSAQVCNFAQHRFAQPQSIDDASRDEWLRFIARSVNEYFYPVPQATKFPVSCPDANFGGNSANSAGFR